jgi:hypothetical protein
MAICRFLAPHLIQTGLSLPFNYCFMPRNIIEWSRAFANGLGAWNIQKSRGGRADLEPLLKKVS